MFAAARRTGAAAARRAFETRALPAPGSPFHHVAVQRPSGDDHRSSSYLVRLDGRPERCLAAAPPAPGASRRCPQAFPVHDLEVAKKFYGDVLGCEEGRSSTKWQDFSLHGHQLVCHWVGNDYRCIDYFNPVDGDEVPVPHFGLAVQPDEFDALVVRLRKHGVTFVIEPTLRFAGTPGEQKTMFFKDPSNNNLEFKTMTNHQWLFAKYNVAPG